MTALYLVPNAYLRKWRQEASKSANAFIPMTLPGLVSQTLKEGLVSYKEDEILEEVAVWQVVQEHKENMGFFAPILHYPGFILELKWLFLQIDLGEEVLQHLPVKGKKELILLHQAYHNTLNELGILDKPSQIKAALKIAQGNLVLPTIDSIQLRGLGELNPLEKQFLHSFAAGRPITEIYSSVQNNKLEVFTATDPYEEVEMIGLAIRQEVKRGVPIEKIGLAFSNPASYTPILLSVFGKLGIPWRAPSRSLRNTSISKGILTLIAGDLEGWHKHHLQLLTAPGWGFPFKLEAEEQRALRLGPSLRGLPAWRNYLGQYSGWEAILELLASLENQLATQPMCAYGVWLEDLLAKLSPDLWIGPEDDLENWAELVKAWDGLEKLAQSLQAYDWICTPKQFLQLLQVLLDNYQIQSRRVFHEQLQVFSIEQFGSHIYDKVFVGGLVEGEFPPLKHLHWLTKTKAQVQTQELYERLVNSAKEVYLYYPETDLNGKLNLPSTLLSIEDEVETREKTTPIHRPSLFLGQGNIQDPEMIQKLQERILQNGLSTSQLNRYANCPYQFFCSYVLDLAPQEEISVELDPRERGIILHDALYKFWSNHLEGPLPSIEKAQMELEGLVRAEYLERGETPSVKLISSLRWFIQEDLARVASGFRPRYLEHWFQGLKVQTTKGRVQIRGQIDRIDLNSQGEYVLYDYKTGSTPSVQDMIQGKDLQIAIYLLAAQGLLKDTRNVGVAYYSLKDAKLVGIFHLDTYKQLLVNKGKGCLPEDQFAVLVENLRETIVGYLEGIFRGDFPIAPASTKICHYCPYQGLCRKEVGV